MSCELISIAWGTRCAEPRQKLALVALADGTKPNELAARCGFDDPDEASDIVLALLKADVIRLTDGLRLRSGRGWVFSQGEHQ